MPKQTCRYGFQKCKTFYELYKRNGGKLPYFKAYRIIRALMKNMDTYMIQTGEKIEIPFFGEIYLVKEKKETLGRNHYLMAGMAEYMYHYNPFYSRNIYMNLYKEPLWYRTGQCHVKKSRVTKHILRYMLKNKEVTYKLKKYK